MLVGTSPFVGAGQFGTRAWAYYRIFHGHPERIAQIIGEAYRLGGRGVQPLPSRTVVDGVRMAEEVCGGLKVVPSVLEAGDVDVFSRFDLPAILIHGSVTDRRDEKTLRNLLRKCGEVDAPVGFVTHKPKETLSWLSERFDFDVVMVPINPVGRFMDWTVEEAAETLRRLGKFVIAKKALAAGSVPPSEAFRFLSQLGCVDSVAVGLASVEEVRETVPEALKYFRETV